MNSINGKSMKTKSAIRVTAAVMVLLSAACLVGCGKSIVGTWNCSYTDSLGTHDLVWEWEFTKDGRFTILGIGSGNWVKKNDGTYFLTFKAGAYGYEQSMYAKLQGSDIIISSVDNGPVMYRLYH